MSIDEQFLTLRWNNALTALRFARLRTPAEAQPAAAGTERGSEFPLRLP